uniref:Uncharacterized protein n=1 Tax=Candidatus Kentrum sp. FM TaxID=2126340 RepID=A0A450SDQ1_9GAMM|nr:MAG: hypothetical protein BECKFM1743C_GA0114222_100888 [Candidatus Kentron sp. FM]VFJ50764.1 MAG: hypothetical protein BECKFM1743A_GA0114220_100878 [Candidatus Kentron sp. FM]VFK08757.1 MAG: hypothetical protein BECKFM1743B_GA0114221_100808 [Candidatus Kentron sp. FM]
MKFKEWLEKVRKLGIESVSIFGVKINIPPIAISEPQEDVDDEQVSTQKGRIKAINGTWEGIRRFEEITEKGLRELDIRAELHADETGSINGIFFYENDKGALTDLVARGNVIDNKYFSLAYRDKDEGVIRYGTFILNLSATGETITGKFIEYRAEIEGLVTGDLTLEKVSVETDYKVSFTTTGPTTKKKEENENSREKIVFTRKIFFRSVDKEKR